MAKAMADIHVKVDKEVKAESEEVLKQIGISFSDLINMTLRRVIYEQRIPFDTRVGGGVPENMKIETEEQLMAYIEKSIKNDDGVRYSIREAEEMLEQRRNEVMRGRALQYEKV